MLPTDFLRSNVNNVLVCSLCSAFYAGLTSRVVLNIREVALGDYNKTAVETQLHDYKDDENPIVPLSFRLRSQG